MEINIPNQVWIYNEINRLLTPHCRHAWYLAVKNFFFCQACLIYGRPIQTTAFRFGIYFWQIRCRVVGSGTRWWTIHKRRTFVSLRKRVGNSRRGGPIAQARGQIDLNVLLFSRFPCRDGFLSRRATLITEYLGGPLANARSGNCTQHAALTEAAASRGMSTMWLGMFQEMIEEKRWRSTVFSLKLLHRGGGENLFSFRVFFLYHKANYVHFGMEQIGQEKRNTWPDRWVSRMLGISPRLFPLFCLSSTLSFFLFQERDHFHFPMEMTNSRH